VKVLVLIIDDGENKPLVFRDLDALAKKFEAEGWKANDEQDYALMMHALRHGPDYSWSDAVSTVSWVDVEGPPIADVFSSCGRRYLDVNGIAVAMEGDICRDPDVVGPMEPWEVVEKPAPWTKNRLERAAELINKNKDLP
jgi:hypothetical protein